MKFLLFVLSVFAVACGGSDFQPELFGAGGDGSGGETQTTGGQTANTGGGAGVAGTGGLPGETGGAPADDSGAQGNTGGSGTGGGGSPSTGGLPAGTGGEATGGSVNTGGVTSTGGATSVLITHDNGLGQTWQDDVALGTHDQTQAMKACEVWCVVNVCIGGCFGSSFCGTNWIVIAQTATVMYSWGFGTANAGTVVRSTNQGATCSSVSTWN